MQVNRTGYQLFALFGVGGFLFVLAGILIGGEVAPTFVLLGSIWMLVTLGLVIYAIRQARKGRHEQWLWKTGIKGKGTLVSAGGHVEINEQPLLKMVLDLEVPGMEPRRIERKVIVSDFAAPLMQPGLVLPVYVNPSDREDILIAW
jgi:hypothetical protein